MRVLGPHLVRVRILHLRQNRIAVFCERLNIAGEVLDYLTVTTDPRHRDPVIIDAALDESKFARHVHNMAEKLLERDVISTF